MSPAEKPKTKVRSEGPTPVPEEPPQPSRLVTVRVPPVSIPGWLTIVTAPPTATAAPAADASTTPTTSVPGWLTAVTAPAAATAYHHHHHAPPTATAAPTATTSTTTTTHTTVHTSTNSSNSSG
jgi:hypothetical protein